MTWNEKIYGTKLIETTLRRLCRYLPPSWTVSQRKPSGRGRLIRSDFLVDVQAPTRKKSTLVVEVKRRVDPKDVPTVLTQLNRSGVRTPFIIAPFLSPRTRDLLQEAGASYADATGNLRLELKDPPVFVQTDGSTTNPWPEKRPLRSLKGPTAGRVVRALCDFRPPFGVRELAQRAETAASSVSRVVGLLDREALLKREGRGTIVEVDWIGMIRRWAQDYSLLETNRTESVLTPRGLSAATDRLQRVKFRYAVTASLAASQLVTTAPTRLLVLYVDEFEEAVGQLDLRPTDAGANMILVEPFDPVVYERTRQSDGIVYAAPSQVAADLLTSPGRGPTEGEELLKWMAEHERKWR